MKKDTGFSSRETNKGQVREFSEIKAVEKLYEQKTYFKNRLLKKNRHLSKWAARNSYGAYRVYNRDIPEIPLSVDIYTDFPSGIRYAVVFLYERPYKTSGSEEERWLESMLAILSDTLSIPEDNIFSRIRKKQRGNNQYGKIVDTGSEKTVRPDNEKTPDDFEITVKEGELGFIVRPQTYLDTGLFIDHRILRNRICFESKGKKILNLFCYTGSFSVFGAHGGGVVTSVDISNTYLGWAKKNFELNGINSLRHEFIREDVFLFLKKALEKKEKWDIIILDPPTFSNSKKMKDFLDINRHWPLLCAECILLLNRGGTLYFSTNSKKLKFSGNLLQEKINRLAKGKDHSLQELKIKDITASTIPEDFKDSKIHKVWEIKL